MAFERNGQPLKEAREWFSVPLEVIDQAIELISSEAITHYEHGPTEQKLRLQA